MSAEHTQSLNDALRAGPSANDSDPPRMVRSGAHPCTRVLVRDLADIAYRGRCVQYADITDSTVKFVARRTLGFNPGGERVNSALDVPIVECGPEWRTSR